MRTRVGRSLARILERMPPLDKDPPIRLLVKRPTVAAYRRVMGRSAQDGIDQAEALLAFARSLRVHDA